MQYYPEDITQIYPYIYSISSQLFNSTQLNSLSLCYSFFTYMTYFASISPFSLLSPSSCFASSSPVPYRLCHAGSDHTVPHRPTDALQHQSHSHVDQRFLPHAREPEIQKSRPRNGKLEEHGRRCRLPSPGTVQYVVQDFVFFFSIQMKTQTTRQEDYCTQVVMITVVLI